MKYKFLSLLLCCTLLSNTVVFAKSATEKVKITTNKSDVYLNGTKIDVDDITVDNSTYLPLRQLSEAMGLKVDYNSKTNEIKLTSGQKPKYEIENTSEAVSTKIVIVDMNSVKVFVDGVRIDAPNILYSGTTYLPLRKISDALGADLDFDSSNNIIYLSTIENGTDTQNNRGAKLKPMLTLEDITYPREPKTVEDFEKVLLYMANYNLTDLELTYNDSFNNLFKKSDVIYNNFNTAFETVGSEYVDLFSWFASVGFSIQAYSDGSSRTKMTLSIGDDDFSENDAISKQQAFEKRALELNNSLKQSGMITKGMSDKEIAEILYKIVTTTVEYDEETYDYFETNFDMANLDSFTGYGAAVNKIAVCQGYTAFYNYLLKLNGIECYGQSGTTTDGVPHIWTVAILDNEKCYIDVTYGDPVPDTPGYTNYDYFCISKEDLMKTRTWKE